MEVNKIILKLDGEPVGKGRPRFNKNGQPYTPERTRNYEEFVQMCYRVQNGTRFIGGNVPIAVTIRAYFGIPKRASKKNRALMLDRKIRPTKKPDADNIAKIILDSLNGLAFTDDAQITGLLVTKEYAESPRVIVEIVAVDSY